MSVVIRSYNRLPWLCELVEALLAQDHDAFEVIVVEQSTDVPADAAARLAGLERDPRLRVVRSAPLGGARARNVGVEHTRGDVVVFIDDDDLPGGSDFLAAMERPFREDPRCVGATARHRWGDREPGTLYRFYAWRRCMRLAPITRVAYTYARHDRPCRVDWVHGTGGAIRRSVFERFGGWDEDTPIEDEASLAYRLAGRLAAGEHLVFDPRATLERRMELPGGLGKRFATAAGFYQRFLTFVHHVLARYHPWRVRLLYPLYVGAGVRWTVAWIWSDAVAYDTTGKRLGATARFLVGLPRQAWLAWRRPFGRPPG
ncbi:MAG: glycosyltransferase, partial [Deltaproteobacteria bacterium]|nr:glycosyltransferase [Kofleriaceae bacterium]